MSPRESLLALEQIGIKLGLDQIRALLGALGRPDLAFPCLVIAGTNGKGSVTAMVERGLRAAGYRTGRYTSPHLVDLEERFAIDGDPIDAATLDGLAARVLTAAGALPAPPSFFEATTALALEAFRDAGVDVAVLEVGLGGRLDATNAVPSVAVAITAVDFDHEAYLGHTLEAIAREKAGVIKPGGLVVLGRNPPAVVRVVAEVARAQAARLVRAADDVMVSEEAGRHPVVATLQTPHGTYASLRFALAGRHQIDNAAVAVRLLEELAATGRFAVPARAIRAAVEDVTWPGRLEWRQWRGTPVLIDGAHNPAGARALAAYAAEVIPHRVPIVVGIMRDKAGDGILAALAPAASCFVCTAAASARALPPGELGRLARRIAPEVEVEVAADAGAALQAGRDRGQPVIVAGSLYLAGEVRRKLS